MSNVFAENAVLMYDVALFERVHFESIFMFVFEAPSYLTFCFIAELQPTVLKPMHQICCRLIAWNPAFAWVTGAVFQ